MAQPAVALAKLAGLKKVIELMLQAPGVTKAIPKRMFSQTDVKAYFDGAASALEILRETLPDLYGDFPNVNEEANCEMAEMNGRKPANQYYREQLERLARHVDQAIEIRANSELSAPTAEAPRKVFISHGRAKDWYAIQAFIERDLRIKTLELAQEANKGLTVLGKLADAADQCDSAVIVMTGDDTDDSGQVRARENVMHEIGYFQGKYGLAKVVLLHEEGVNIPSNIQGLVYIPFPKGLIEAVQGVLMRELHHIYSQ